MPSGIKNLAKLKAKFEALHEVAQIDALSTAVTVGMLPIQNEIVLNAPYLTGTYKRGWHNEITTATAGYARGEIGNQVPYGLRLEFGYSATDSLGRTYNQPARPHVRPAIEAKKAEAITEIGAALSDILNALI